MLPYWYAGNAQSVLSRTVSDCSSFWHCAVDDADIPLISLLFVVNFTASSYNTWGKTIDYKCSNNYGHQFKWRIGLLTQRISGANSLPIRAVDVPKCASADLDIVVTPHWKMTYRSEYSRVCVTSALDLRSLLLYYQICHSAIFL